jgi:hypothetical protein
MADNYSQATVSPDLPAELFTDEELRSLEFACGLTCERSGENLYFFAELCFYEQGEDADGFGVDCLSLLQEKLLKLDPAAYPHISIQGAATCSKMRPDEFGGFAYFIARDHVRSMATWAWLHDRSIRTHSNQPGRHESTINRERKLTMTLYNVHIYREMRIVFEEIEAGSHEAAAAIARNKPTSDAMDDIDCEGESFCALVDVAGDEEYAQSRYIDFEPERQRKAAPKLLDTLKVAEGYVHWALDHGGGRQGTPAALKLIRNTIAEAEACGIRAETSATRWLSALKAVLPYAESERASLEQCWGRGDDARIKEELDACDRALDQALALILEAHSPGNNAPGGAHEPR